MGTPILLGILFKRLLPLLGGVPDSWEHSAAFHLGGTPSRDSGVLFPAPGFNFPLAACIQVTSWLCGRSFWLWGNEMPWPSSSPAIALTVNSGAVHKKSRTALAQRPCSSKDASEPSSKTRRVTCGGQAKTTAFNSAARPVPLSH